MVQGGELGEAANQFGDRQVFDLQDIWFMAIPWVLFDSSSKAFFWPVGCLIRTICQRIKGESQSIALKINIQKYTARANIELPIVSRIRMDSSLLCAACYFSLICAENQLPFGLGSIIFSSRLSMSGLFCIAYIWLDLCSAFFSHSHIL